MNKFNNITIINKALSNISGKSKFGGNGELGNSESTLLIADDDFLKRNGRQTTKWKNQQKNIVEIDTITIDDLIKEQNIDPETINLIKMDIEGGEIIVVPHIKKFLKKYKPVFYISLHYCFLKKSDIEIILNHLFEIYEKCYYFNDIGEKHEIKKKFILKKNITTIVFE